MHVLGFLIPLLFLGMVHYSFVLRLEVIILLQITSFVGILDRLELSFVLLPLVGLVEIHMEILLVVLFEVPIVAESVLWVLFRRVWFIHLLVLELVLLVSFFVRRFLVVETECMHWLLLTIFFVLFNSGKLALRLAAALALGLLRCS